MLIICITVTVLGLLIYVKPAAAFFKFQSLNLSQLSISIVIGFFSVLWYEVIKWRKRTKGSN